MNYYNPFGMQNIFNPFANFMPQQSIFFNPVNYYPSYPNSTSIFTPQVQRSERPAKVSSGYKISSPKNEKTYNKVIGEKLAKKVVANLPSDRDPEHPMCAKYVKEAVEDCGLGEYIKGNGAHCKYVFRANPNFKEIKSKDFSTLPAGSVIVYQAGDKVKFKDGSTDTIGENGHVTIALGDGRACSDIIEDEIAYSGKANTFIPV